MIILLLITVTGHEYLLVDPVAPRVGMGYALAADGYSVHYNPAGLAYDTCGFYSASYLNYIEGTHFGFLGYDKNQIGIGLRYFNGGRMKKTDAQGGEYGTFGAHFFDLNVGKGFFWNGLGVGGSLKLVYEMIDTLTAIGVGGDLGALYYLDDPELQLGLAVKNIGTTVKAYIQEKELFPYEINAGVAKVFSQGWLGLDLVKPALSGIGVRIGAEYAVATPVRLRVSYNSILSSMRTGSNGLDILTGLTVGFGVRVAPLIIDFSYSPYFDLGGGIRMSVSLGG